MGQRLRKIKVILLNTFGESNMVNRLTGEKSSAQKGLDNCLEQFSEFTDGIRVIFLLFRGKDGGDKTDEDQRSFSTRVSFNSKEFAKNLKELWLLQEEFYPECRIYSSVNPRDLKKSIFTLKKKLLFAETYDDIGRQKLFERVIKSSRHILMQPSSAVTSLFIIDIDKEIISGELPKINEHTEILKIYKTKNGWHVVTKPFNPALYKGEGEIKKDGLILLKY